MRRLANLVVVVACLMVVPAAAFAQASIAGVVKDTSGAVLPGVTVEAASPALIEKTRVGVTRQRVIDHKVIDAVPTGRGAAGVYNLALLIPGVSQGSANTVQDVGGSSGTYLSRLKVHGSNDGDQLLTKNGASMGSIEDVGPQSGRRRPDQERQSVVLRLRDVQRKFRLHGRDV